MCWGKESESRRNGTRGSSRTVVLLKVYSNDARIHVYGCLSYTTTTSYTAPNNTANNHHNQFRPLSSRRNEPNYISEQRIQGNR
jgi:hypothetical protein